MLSTHSEEVTESATLTPLTLADSSSRIPDPIYSPGVYKTRRKRLRTYKNYTEKIPATLCADAGFVNTCDDIGRDKNLEASQSANGTSVVTVQTDAATPNASTAGCSQQLDLYNKFKNKFSELAIKEVESHSESSSTQLYHRWHYQKNRQKTFEQLIAKSNSPQWKVFAADGFYLKSDNAGILIMECIFCQLGCKFTLEEAGDTEFKSKVKTNHEQRGCRFILGEKNQPHKNIPDIFEDATWTEKGIDDNNNAAGENNETRLGINFSQAAHPDMAVPDRRKATFLTFPHGSAKQPDELSDSGCFYSGGDSVTCFSCDTKLSNFDHGEDVWTRHVRCSPNCTFIRYHKGQDFINRVLERHGAYVEPRSEPRITNITTRMLRPRIDSPAVAKALSMGLDREDVKTAIGNRIKKGEQDFRWAAEIFRAVNIEKVPTQVLNEASINLPRVIQEAEAAQEEEAEVDVDEEMEVVEELVEKDEVDGITKSERKETEESTMMEEEPTKLAQLIKSQLTCKICLSDIVGIIFIPCGHLVCCTMCSAAMSQCPICRHSINGTIKANF
ncbi:death-associated inhibitor of apoptosis 2-like [Watersipora subatra]|uniref:death-associated inhibitor of apoptosis 2-like n=1 Tax=Watersipora subatra TaxID=2589382 RepID=UPI00355C0F67